MWDRILGVFKLDVATFEEIEHDTTATTQAAIVVLIVALVAAIGSGIGATIADGNFISSFIGQLITTFVGWLIWSAVTYFVGTSLFGGKATLDEMLRVIGFAYAPQILGIIPCVGAIIGFIWTLIAGFIAVRQGLDLDNGKAFLTIVVGAIAYAILLVILGTVFGLGGAFLSSVF